MSKALQILFVCTIYCNALAQKTEYKLDDFYRQLAYHPLIYQTGLSVQETEKQIQQARGMFDPTVGVEYFTKDYTGKNYYTKWNNVLKIPTWLGADLKVLYENNSGTQLNGEDYTPKSGLWAAGVSVPIGQGLLIDQRRATLRDAQIGNRISQYEQIKNINKIVFEATKAYLDWADSYNEWLINKEFMQLITQRKNAVAQSVVVGENAAIDSVEITIEYQRRLILLNNSAIDLYNYRMLLSNYLWEQGSIPLELDSNALPQNLNTIAPMFANDTVNCVENAMAENPELVKLRLKTTQLGIEKRLAIENIKPRLNVEYYPLFTSVNGGFNSNYISNNYKMGVSFYTPLFLRKERAKLALVKIKLNQNESMLSVTNRDITIRLRYILAQIHNLEKMITMQENNNVLMDKLRAAEEEKFVAGESNVFMVNTRERNLLEAQLKLVEYRIKYIKHLAELRWQTGTDASKLLK